VGHQRDSASSLLDRDDAGGDELPQGSVSSVPRQANGLSGTISESDWVPALSHEDQAIELDQERPSRSTQLSAREFMATGMRYTGEGFDRSRAPGRHRRQFPAQGVEVVEHG